MAADLTVDADLAFSVHVPGSRPVTGVLAGSGSTLQLRVSDPSLFAGRSDARAVRGLARGLAGRGLSIRVVSPSGPLITIGAGPTSWLQRLLTGSWHIRVERGTRLWPLVRRRARSGSAGALPTGRLTPPATLFPMLPTMAQRNRRAVTTTDGPYGGGHPRMIMAPRPYPKPGDQQQVFGLRKDVTTIGSGPDCDIRLAGLEPLHAEIRHDDKDEFVLVRIGAAEATRVHGAPVETAVLRTGAGVDLGGWVMSFSREVYADHGRPFGGRIGGELGHQRSQPSKTWTRSRDKRQD